MKIIHLTSHFYPRIGGVEKHVLNIAKIQIDLGHDVIVVAGQYGKAKKFEIFEGIKIYRFPAERSSLRMKLWHIRHALIYLQADILHIHNLMSTVNIFRLLLTKSKTVLTLHGWGGIYPIPEKHKNATKINARRYAKKIITVGRFINKWYDLESNLTIYGAISTSLLDTSSTQVKKYDICIFGRLEEDAGINIYIDGLSQIINFYPDKLKICICGDGQLKGYILNQLKGADVSFKGFVTDPIKYVKRSKYCFTSGYLGILECLAVKTKVFSVFDNPLKEDYLKLSPFEKYIYIAGDTKTLIQQLQNELLQNAPPPVIPDFVFQSTWEALAKKFEYLYEEIRK